MTQREQIERMYEDKGLDACWAWAKGHTDRWKALKEWAEAKAKNLGDELRAERKDIEEAEHDLHELADLLKGARQNREANKANLAKATDPARIRELESRAAEIEKTIDAIRDEIKDDKNEKKKSRVAAHHAKREKLAWIERKVVYREQWEKAKRLHASKGGGFQNAEWEDWMAHGLDANVTPFVKKVMAWGVLEYDLTITSLRRNFVPPGGSTTSYHLSGQAGDIAGPRMSEFQSALFDAFVGNGAMLEMFGPINDKCLKFGNPLTLGEGDPLETLHDTHVHAGG